VHSGLSPIDSGAEELYPHGSERLTEGPAARLRRGTIDGQSKSLSAEDLDECFLAEPARRHTSGLPSQGMNDMSLDHMPSGRLERRLPIIVIVRLAQADRASTPGEERTFTDNISAHGARIFSRHPWQPGDEVIVTPLNDETTWGNVVYCQRLADDRFGIGVKFKDRTVMWSAMRKYDGIRISPQPDPNPPNESIIGTLPKRTIKSPV
jgi:hypothetical protein